MTTHPSKLYYSIGEVADQFGVNESLLRFWEKEFDSIKPKKNAKGTRMYTKEDIEAIRQVYYLVKDRKMTLAGAKAQLKTKGRKVVAQVETYERLNKVKEMVLSLKRGLSELEPTEDNQPPIDKSREQALF
ncbi:MAG TPA: transcriptional regulator [Bacteroidales bacterium]|nr:transcriptional regulator [Bacteroidales bacterium]